MKFTRVPPDSKGYPGLTRHEYAPGRSLTVLGSGPQAEKAIREAMEKKRENGIDAA